MHPVKAAEVVSLAAEYLADDADVLDPFCGTATLLIELPIFMVWIFLVKP